MYPPPLQFFIIFDTPPQFGARVYYYNLEQNCITLHTVHPQVYYTSSEICNLNRFFYLNRIVNAILKEIRDMHQFAIYGANF